MSVEFGSQFILGSKNGKPAYFNIETGETHDCPQPGSLKRRRCVPHAVTKTEPIPFAFPLATADADTLGGSSNSVDIDLDMSEVEMLGMLDLDSDDDKSLLEKSSSMMVVAAAEEVVPKQEPQSQQTMSKSELKKYRNRKAAEKSRRNKQQRMREKEIKISELEDIVRDLQQRLAISEAEKKGLQDQVQFLRTLVQNDFNSRGGTTGGVSGASFF